MKTVGFQQLNYGSKVIPFSSFLDNKTVVHSGLWTEPPVGVTLQPLCICSFLSVSCPTAIELTLTEVLC